jgi:hypothetical protein
MDSQCKQLQSKQTKRQQTSEVTLSMSIAELTNRCEVVLDVSFSDSLFPSCSNSRFNLSKAESEIAHIGREKINKPTKHFVIA